MTDQEQRREDRRVISRLGWLLLAVSLPLAGAALLWWLPKSWNQTVVVSIVVIVLSLAGWYYWRED